MQSTIPVATPARKPHVKPTNQDATPARKPRLKPTNQDLPYGTYRLWTRTFIPTYLAFIGAQCDPFLITGLEAAYPMQQAWDLVYPDTPCDTMPRTTIFVLVSPGF
jgi:hypothetical protein